MIKGEKLISPVACMSSSPHQATLILLAPSYKKNEEINVISLTILTYYQRKKRHKQVKSV